MPRALTWPHWAQFFVFLYLAEAISPSGENTVNFCSCHSSDKTQTETALKQQMKYPGSDSLVIKECFFTFQNTDII